MRAHALAAVAAAALLACTGATHGGRPAASTPTPTPTAARATSWTNWYAYHGSSGRAGYSPTMPAPASGLRINHRLSLDGPVYGSPIVWRNVTIVATENNTVYAFSSTFRLLWKRHLGTPSPSGQHPCAGNINPRGITGTPTYASATNSVYVAAELSGNPPTHRLYAINFSTGGVRWSRSLDLAGVDQSAMQQRGALLTTSAGVYVPFGGIAGDCGNYKGRIVRWALNGSGSARAYTVPTAREAGMWTPPGPVYAGGYLFAAVGNGAATGGSWDGSDSVLKLSSALSRVDYFAPSNWASENAGDVDLGSQGPAVVGPWIYQAGKSGTSFVLRRGSLGHIGGQVSRYTAHSCHSFGGTAVWGHNVYVPCTEGVTAFRILDSGQLQFAWRASGVAGSPVIGGGRVWAMDAGGGRLYSLSQRTGAVVTSISVGTANRFATPALYGHRVIVGTLSGVVAVNFS